VIRTTLCCSWVAVAIAIMPGAARAQAPGAAPPPPVYPPQRYPAPPPPPPSQPPMSSPPVAAPYGPPASAPPTYVPPTYAPPGYTPPPYSAPIYAPTEISDFDEDAPVPYGYTKVSRRRRGPIIGGAVTLGVSYTISLFTALVGAEAHSLEESEPDLSSLLVPVAGPFLQLQDTRNSVGRFWLTVLGTGQVTGAVLLIYGLSNPRTVLVRNDQLSLVPIVGHGASGLALSGRF
jgi:hypothetical protein